VGGTSGRGNRRGLDGFTERFEDTLTGIHLGDEAMIRIGSRQRGQESGKTCILDAPSRPLPGPGFHRSVRVDSPKVEHNSMKVFLSYSHRDDALASRLTKTLESEGVRVWYGSRDILPGDNWAEKIAKALADSDAMVVLISPSALESSSVKREIEYALGKTTIIDIVSFLS
jgi:hypothetical protein